MEYQERESHTYAWVLKLAILAARHEIVRYGGATSYTVAVATRIAARKVRPPVNFTPTDLTTVLVYKASLEACRIVNLEAAKGIYNVQRS